MRRILSGAAIGFGLFALTETTQAADPGPGLSDHPKSTYYRRGGNSQVRGYTARRGGYSYNYADSLNTYGNPRTQYGGTNLYRDPMLDRQTNSAPFDLGFFFDSVMGPHGGDSPYMH
jgi:hypothetical protein